jgi:Ca2+-transporting ATPase
LLALEQVATDPIETEVQNFARKINIDFEKLYKEHILVDDAPFESKSKMVHHLWANQKGDKIQYSAGAPEFIIKQSALSDKQTKDAMNAYEKMASQGYRVIGVAKKETDDSKILVSDLEFVGLLAMSDPPRAGVKEAIEICQKAGIRVIMITGDNKLTAHSVAEQIGLKHNEDIVVGSEMENVSMDAIKNIVKKHDIFTRVKPEQKYQIVEALQNLGETVAMTGDGVNDAPALKKADIGIAMGKKGTDVARAAAGIVLMEDNFASIVNSIKEGRRIYDNLRQAFLFLFSFHIPIIGLALLPLFFGHPLIFAPIHIIFLELICDPAAVLGFEREKARKNLMAEKPKPKNEPLVNKKMIGKILIYGLSILGVSFGLYWHYAITLGNEEMGRTASLLSLIISQIILIIATREWPQVKSNGLLLSITILTLLSIVAIIKIGVVRELFYLSPLDFKHSIAMFAIPALVMSAIAISSKILHLNKN